MHRRTKFTRHGQLTTGFLCTYELVVGPYSSVGITTCYGVDGPGIESRWGRDFPQRPELPWGPPSLNTMATWSFAGVKRPGRGVDHLPPI